ncbi:cobaltochelatase subunit CobN [Methylocapsa acidiphila]|uniref:cobaltochelatase subunit CobN n=1 Tax=Methylocapsa acidiphila TaxID=133552 RepID=UPI0004221248|nr:cobaltochelatase subunit CobN [Methylocapsa acidiphila]
MHLLRSQSLTLDEAEAAIDLGQTPADLVFLSFSDSDLAIVAAAQARQKSRQSLRLANLGKLKHPYSVDLYVEKLASKARFVLVRLLGGLDYWRYGVEELARAARAQNFTLAIIPGDATEDPRLDAASTLPIAELRRMSAAFQHGGVEGVAALLSWIETFPHAPAMPGEPTTLPAAGRCEAACRAPAAAAGRAFIVFYRAFLLAGDLAPIEALADALAARSLSVSGLFATSLKDAQAIAFLRTQIAREKPDVIVNTTGFSARLDDGRSPLDEADCPVLQAILAGSSEAQWKADPRGLGAADLAMNVVLPEMDGRLISTAIGFKTESLPRADLEFTPLVHAPTTSGVDRVADLAAAWTRLRKVPQAKRKIGCVLSDYPGKAGRAGYAVGLDAPQSVASIAAILRDTGYDVGTLPPNDELMRGLEAGAATERLSLADYKDALRAMPGPFVESLLARWGEPEADPLARQGAFHFSILRARHLLVALQPDRGASPERKADYHDSSLPPRHSYVAFYVFLRRSEQIDAMIHCGTHGTLEWLPGKAVALAEDCAPAAVLGPLPVVYPFIVNNPGEAAQAKRRIGALTLSHMTPPLTEAGSHGAALEIEALFDEYAAAESLDPKRARLLAKAILERAEDTGLARDCGLDQSADPSAALTRLDAWLCDLKEMRIGDGLHVFGQSPCAASRDANAPAETAMLIDACGLAEATGLVAALDGRFVPPGPGGAPSRGRLDVLPTGRNLYGVDPRAVPTRTAFEIGRRAAREVLNRHAQDHGDWPKRIIMDLWASATMRTGGDDLAQALALMGVMPVWDFASSRVSGFEILPLARLDHPRVDVTLRISGLFRDVFPAQIALFDQAVRAVAALDEDDDSNPLAAARRRSPGDFPRIFGAGPQAYGIGVTRTIDADPSSARDDLGRLYLAATSHAYGGPRGEGAASAQFSDRVAEADALVHVQDQDEGDVLDSDALVDHEGGFAAAARLLGNDAPVYHVETTRPDAIRARTLPEEVARVVRARASNPRWIAGQMRHGHRGAAEIALTIDNLFALAVLADAVASQHFDLMFEATCGAQDVRDFLIESNPKAARAIVERFEEAHRRGVWKSRRNSVLDRLAEMRGALP